MFYSIWCTSQELHLVSQYLFQLHLPWRIYNSWIVYQTVILFRIILLWKAHDSRELARKCVSYSSAQRKFTTTPRSCDMSDSRSWSSYELNIRARLGSISTPLCLCHGIATRALWEAATPIPSVNIARAISCTVGHMRECQWQWIFMTSSLHRTIGNDLLSIQISMTAPNVLLTVFYICLNLRFQSSVQI